MMMMIFHVDIYFQPTYGNNYFPEEENTKVVRRTHLLMMSGWDGTERKNNDSCSFSSSNLIIQHKATYKFSPSTNIGERKLIVM